ncbi:LacI family transcriptional regulator [Ktedonobacter sp. SOSP1-85]|uniref:LacI family DNA-binding transcriptional regulator n=1 Tax=Ktedonobacter sp. SOSP1-85 TaxID=2778367 RepID=UPI001916BECC|nr:LacI family DNA-binding transcriptional regulator [Ktedonobacter sp. SOSP1-85]GHO81552.1 LacI family transcriptional regulator [Ktedonobacter sp. SOSP1-85]
MPQLTIEDIARLAGVSRSTVSRVLNSQPSVRPAVRDRVQEVIIAHGYTPQAAARQLATQRTRSIGLILPDNVYNLFGNPIFALMSQGVSQVCAQQGYTSLLFMGRQDMNEQDMFKMLRGREFDGVVLISSNTNDTYAAFLKETGIPYTRIGHEPGLDDLRYVDVDNVEAARIGVKHLISLGHWRIAMLKGLARDTCTSDRYQGYKEALEEAGIPLDPELVGDGDWSTASGYELTKRFLRLERPPTALFSSNDMMVAGVIRAAHEQGRSVPEDLAIVGFDDLPQTTMIFPDLTTIRQPCVELGIRAAEMLIEQLEHDTKETKPMHVILPTTLVIRESCGSKHRPVVS